MRFTKIILLIISIIGLLLWRPSVDYAQKSIRVGVVFSGNIPYYRKLHKDFLRILKEQLPEANIKLLIQRPNPDPLAWSNAVRKLLVYDSQILIVYGSGALNAALQEDVNIPIIFAGTFRTRLNNRRGKKLSGVYNMIHLSSVIRYLKKLKPTNHLDILYSEIEPSSIHEADELKALCKDFSLNCSLHSVGDYDGISSFVDTVNADAVFVTESALLARYLPEFQKRFIRKNIPLVTTTPGLEQITVFSLTPDIRYEARTLAGVFIDLVKNKKADKIQTVHRTTLTFNLGIARRLQTNIPTELISYADEVIK